MKETRRLEFKETVSGTYLKTVSAFANYDGGVILFGVSDTGEVVGLDDVRQKCLDIENAVNDGISPQPDYSLDVTNAGKTITLTVRPGKDKPYLYRSKAYRRSGTSTVQVDRAELKRLVLAGENTNYEELPSRDQDLRFSYLEKELVAKTGIRELSTDILKTLALYHDRDGYNIAAAILADRNDLPGIDIARFGETISIFQKRLTLEHQSALKSYHDAVEVYRDYYQYEVVDGSVRRLVETIPEEAFREALVNALVHRVWDVNAHVRVSMFDDRIEIVSVGGLPDAVSVDRYLQGDLSILRNPILANVFHRLGLIEQFGTGVRRIRQAYSCSVTQPTFRVADSIIEVILPLLSDTRDLTADERLVYGALSRSINQSISEIMDSSRITFGRSKVKELLKAMAGKGAVLVEGTGRGTKYRIL